MGDHSHHHQHHSPSETTEMPHNHDHHMHSDNHDMSSMDSSSSHQHGMSGHMMSMFVSWEFFCKFPLIVFHKYFDFQFHGGCNETILFSQWTINSCSGLVWSMIAIFILAVFYEGLKYYREHLFWKSYNNLQYRAVSEKNGTAENMNNDSRVVQ